MKSWAIDFHTHAFPDRIAEKAMNKLTGGSGYKAYHNGTIKGLLNSMEEAGVYKSIICSIATNPDQIENIIEWSRSIKSDRIEPFFSLFPGVKIEEYIEKAIGYGLTGVKLHPQYQDFEADNAEMFSIYDAIQQTGLILILHSGLDLAYPGDLKAAPSKMARIIKNFSKLKLVLAHFGGYRMWNDVEEYIAGKDIYLETSFILKEAPDMFYKILKKHNSDLIIFGTDSPWLSQSEEKERVLRAKISDELKEKILYKNAELLLNNPCCF